MASKKQAERFDAEFALKYTAVRGSVTTFFDPDAHGFDSRRADVPDVVGVDIRNFPESTTQVDLRTPDTKYYFWDPDGNGAKPMDQRTEEFVEDLDWPAAAIEHAGYEVA